MPKAITYIDLFSGIGGFREGLSRAGDFVCVGHCEIDKYADQSYRALFDTRGDASYTNLTLPTQADGRG